MTQIGQASTGVHRAFAELSGRRLVVVPPKSDAGDRTVTNPGVLVTALRTHLDGFVDLDPEALVFTGDRGGTPKRGSWRAPSSGRRECVRQGSRRPVDGERARRGTSLRTIPPTKKAQARGSPSAWAFWRLERVTRIELA